jgi:hypothetical protein
MQSMTKRQMADRARDERRAVIELQDPTTSSEHRKLLEGEMLKFLPSSGEDFLSLVVRRGVSHDGYELLLRDRLLTAKGTLVESAIRLGTLDKLAKSYVDRLQSRLFTGQEPIVATFRVMDVERERLDELEGVLRQACGEIWLSAFIEQSLEGIEGLAASWEKPMKTITKIRLLREACIEEIDQRMKGKKQNG